MGSKLRLVAVGILLLVVGFLVVPSQPSQAAPETPTATCTVPYTQTIRGKDVTWDQCYIREFSHGGTDYVIRAYYTEFFDPTPGNDVNYDACSPGESNPQVRCEHAIPDLDNGNGDNIYAVQLATEAEGALRFYIDQSIPPMPATDFYIYIAEDPKNGWIVNPDGIITDDEKAETNDILGVRWNVYHEMQHLIQQQFKNGNWALWWTEGLARAIEDRVDPALDAAEKAFIVDSRRMLNNAEGSGFPRSSDLLEASYRGVVWWTWVLDQYKDPGDVDPVIGWDALKDFYSEIQGGADSLTSAQNFIAGQGGNFANDFIDYTLAMYAYRYNPTNPRLGFLDSELISLTSLQNHTEIDNAISWQPTILGMSPRSSRYWEFTNASVCDYVGFTFDGGTRNYAFTLMAVDNGNLVGQWTRYGTKWARAIRSADLERVAGVITSVDGDWLIGMGYGCIDPTLTIESPTTSGFKMVGTAENPRQFIIRLAVRGQDNAPVEGLAPGAFQVTVTPPGGGGAIPASIVNAVYVQERYWLLVQAPDDIAGAQTGAFHDLTVSLDTYDSDTQANALLYVDQTLDKVIVMDRSGSMGDGGKLGAAQNAAALMANELSDDDQGGYVAFDGDAYLRLPLDAMSAPGHRSDLETFVMAETPGGATSIGDGMLLAAQEHDANGIADNACTFVLLSDGYENQPAYWADVAGQVVDNGCTFDVIAFGPEANEDLLQQIAGASIGADAGSGNGGYDYAPDTGSLSFNTAGGTATIGWENNLSRIYDYKASQAAGRQRIFSNGRTPGAFDEHTFQVDATTEELVVAIAWQNASSFDSISLLDPDGLAVSTSYRRRSPFDTNEVWRVPLPDAGEWTLGLRNMPEEYYVSASAITDLQLHAFAGGDVDNAYPGMKVPILASFINLGAPVTGATVRARVTAPNGAKKLLTLYDDGAHGDTEPDDGVYGAFYPVTSLGELVATDPQGYPDGSEPSSTGSYLVDVEGIWGVHRREAQAGFVLQRAEDGDGDGLPDPYEEANGLDPKDPNDGRRDHDGDGLLTLCELDLGTDPFNSDTDNGGESDGSEVPNCVPGRMDPLDPDDDRVGTFAGLRAVPEATETGPFVVVEPVGISASRYMTDVIIYLPSREEQGSGDGFTAFLPISATGVFTDDKVMPGKSYRYRLIPVVRTADGSTHEGGAVETEFITVKSDPYPPDGSIIINDDALSTTSKNVVLSIGADDLSPSHGSESEEPRPGAATADLMMRISNTPSFDGLPWIPYAPAVDDWVLEGAQIGELASVYLQLMDPSGNIGAAGLGMTDSILYVGSEVYLPLVMRGP